MDEVPLVPLSVPPSEPERAGNVWKVGKYTFRADYDSSNLANVQQGANSAEFLLWTRKDCEGTPAEKPTRTWFYFGVSGGAPGDFIVMTLMNLNKQSRLYSQDYRPWVWRQGRNEWSMIPNKCMHKRDGEDFQVRFNHKFESSDETFFAFAIPFSYLDCQNFLALLDELHGAPLLNTRAVLSTSTALTSTANSVPDAAGPASPSAATAPAPLSSSTCALPRIDSWGGGSRHASPASWPGEELDLDNRSGEQGLGRTSQGTLGGVAASTPGLRHALEGGTADHRSPGQQQPHASSRRRSADSGLDAGQMQTLLHETVHQRSPLQPLQQQGPPVPCGLGVKDTDIYYRRQLLIRTIEGRRVDLITITDCFGASGDVEAPPEGVLQPGADDGGGDAALFPGKKVFFISARVHPGETPATHMFNGLLSFLLRRHDARAAALRRAFVFKLVPMVNPDGVFHGHYRTDTLGQNLNRSYLGTPSKDRQPSVWAIKKLLLYYAHHAQQQLEYYIDLHAHANKKGVFAFGNAQQGERQVSSLLYSRLCALNSPVFDFLNCNFTEKNMSRADKDGTSKEGAGRVALFKETGLLHLYTVEANYNVARVASIVPPASGDHGGRASPSGRRPPPRLTADMLQGAGRALVISALDLMGHNPWSRLPNSEHRSLEGARSWLLACMRASEDTRANELPPMDDASVRSVAGLGLGTDAGTTAANRKPRGALPPSGSGRLAGPAGGAAAGVAFGSAVSVPGWRTKPPVEPWARSAASTSTSKPAANSATAATAVEGRVAGLKATSASSSGASSSANATKAASHSTSASGVNARSSAAAARAHSLDRPSSLRCGHPTPSGLPAASSNSQFLSTAKAVVGGRASPSLPSISSGDAKSLRPASSLAQRRLAPLAVPKKGTGGPAKPGPSNDTGLARIQRHSAPGSDSGGSNTQRPDANSVQAHVGIAHPSADASAQACGGDWTAPVPDLSDGLGAGGLPGMAGLALHAPCADGDDDDGEGSDSDGSDQDEIERDVQGGASARMRGSTAASDSAWHLPHPCPERVPQSGDVQGALSSLQQAVQPAMTTHTAENLSSGASHVQSPNGLGPALSVVPLAAAASKGSSAGPAGPLHRRPPAQGQAASDKGGRVLQGSMPVPAGVGVPAQKVASAKAGSRRAAAGQVLPGAAERSASAVTKAKPIANGAVQSAAPVKLTGSPLIAMPAASGKGLRAAPKAAKK